MPVPCFAEKTCDACFRQKLEDFKSNLKQVLGVSYVLKAVKYYSRNASNALLD
jgi:hypothetical protein